MKEILKKRQYLTVRRDVAEQLLGVELREGGNMMINTQGRDLQIVWVNEGDNVFGHWIVFTKDGSEMTVINHAG